MRTSIVGAIIACIVIIFLAVSIVMRMGQNQQVTSTRLNTPKYTTQENEGGNVTVVATPETVAIGRQPRFKVTFDTHSVDLAFDIATVSKLIDDTGKIYGVARWEGTPPGGHHRTGTLTFQELLKPTKYVDLIITNVSGVPERKLRWKL